jgi:hypothetical protein
MCGMPLEQYGPENLQRGYHEVKSCAPLCTIGCMHRVAQVDELRRNPQAALSRWLPDQRGERAVPPLGIRILIWAFVTGLCRDLLRNATMRVLTPLRTP